MEPKQKEIDKFSSVENKKTALNNRSSSIQVLLLFLLLKIFIQVFSFS